MTGKDRESRVENSAFSDALTELEDGGCNFLVVGPVPGGVHHRVSQQLFGAETAVRHRLLVLLARNDAELESRFGFPPSQMPPGTVSVVRHSMFLRSTATDVTREPFSRRVDTDRLSDLGRAISEEVLEFVRSTTRRAPGWFRLGFDSLLPLLENYETEPVFRLLRTMTHRIRDVSGMGHFHLSVPMDAYIVDQLRPIFDGLVEIRRREGGYQQRWHLIERDLSSPWHRL
jgi:hypothetical protein